jgi:hypothetical protein
MPVEFTEAIDPVTFKFVILNFLCIYDYFDSFSIREVLSMSSLILFNILELYKFMFLQFYLKLNHAKQHPNGSINLKDLIRI